MPENKYFDKKIKTEIVDKLKPNQKITVVILNAVALYSPVQMYSIISDEKEYKKAPFLFLVFSYLRNSELKEFLKDLQIIRFESKGSWSAVTFIKWDLHKPILRLAELDSASQKLTPVRPWIYFASESRSCKLRLRLSNSIRQFRATCLLKLNLRNGLKLQK